MNNFNWHPDDYQNNTRRDNEPKSLMVVPEKKNKKASTRTWIACILSSLLTAAIMIGSFSGVLYYNGFFDEKPFVSDKDTPNNQVDITDNVFSQVADRADKDELSGPAIYQKVSPIIVGVATKGISKSFYSTTPVDLGTGSGIIISSDGYIVTNYHVVEGATEVNISVSTGETYKAEIIAQDPTTDIALLKIDATRLPAATLGNSDDLLVGEKAYAIGNPLGLDLNSSFTGGYISGLNRMLTIDKEERSFIQTDAAINPGNSGGALVNSYGEVIGINTIKFSSTEVEGIGFAIPINEVKYIVNELMNNGYVTGRPLIGISGYDVTEEVKAYYKFADTGVYIGSVEKFSNAEKVGFQIGDIITHVNDTRIASIDELNTIKDKHKAGETLSFTINRDGEVFKKDVELMEKKPEVKTETPTKTPTIPIIPGR